MLRTMRLLCRGPRKAPEEEREFKRDDEIDKLPPNERQAQVRLPLKPP